MAKTKTAVYLVPTRRQRSKLQIALISQHMMDSLISGWGLTTALAVTVELQKLLRAEKARRKELEEK